MGNDFDEALAQIIEEKARVLADFSLPEKVCCGSEEIRKRLWSWCRNFYGILSDYSLLAILVKEIEIIEDKVILNDFLEAKKQICHTGQPLFLCPFGEPQGSSYRIMAPLNKEPNYNDSLRNLLDKIDHECKVSKKSRFPKIVFIDDFLNSGGQFRRILNSWRAIDTGVATKQNIDSRACDNLFLSPKQFRTLQQCSLVFFFYVCTEGKRLELESELRDIFPTCQIIIHRTIPENGIFGTKKDVECITSRSETYLSGKSIFGGKKGKDVFELYHVCREAGLQLLRTNEPAWTQNNIEDRCLGYGNSPRLYIGQNNIPTLTLTALWQSGPVNIDGKSFLWQEFLPRRKKITIDPEDPKKTVKPIIRLGERGDHSSCPLEIHIIGDLEALPQNDTITTPGACGYLSKYFDPVATGTLKADIKILSRNLYAKFNNHLKWILPEHDLGTEQKIDVSISRIQLLPFDARTIFSAAIKINADNMLADQMCPLLKQAREVDYKLKKKKDGFLRLQGQDDVKYSVSDFLSCIFGAAQLKMLKQNFYLMYFMRLDGNSPSCSALELNPEMFRSLTLNSADHFNITDFQAAAAAVSDKIGAFIASSAPINDSGLLQKEVAEVYCFLEMLNRRCLSLMQMKKFSPMGLTPRDEETLGKDKFFFLNAYSTNLHVKQYMSLLRSRIEAE